MAKGKGKKKKKKVPKIDPNALTEVDKTFYELTITDLNRKLARLRSLTEELEVKNEELKTSLSTLDEDRNDIIIYLKRLLQERSDEIAELQDRLHALQETRSDETKKFEEKIAELENEYRQMREELTSEIKLLEGKLNSLEEFRIMRDELMKKFEDQEDAMEAQEKRHKNELYQMERKFIIGKDKLKKDMEARLLQLSSEFQDATELRIAATTHRVIRENIAINNELDAMLITHNKLHCENTGMVARDTKLRQEAQLHEAEKNKALAKAHVQRKIIDRLTKEHHEMKDELNKYRRMEKDMHQATSDLENSKKTINNLSHNIRVLEQNLHACRCRITSTKTELEYLQDENNKLGYIMKDAVAAISGAIRLRESSESLKGAERDDLLTHLFNLLTAFETKEPRRPSLETVGSLSATYERGDLGFVPKPGIKRSVIQTSRHMEAQVGASFEEFLKEPEIAQEQEEGSVGTSMDKSGEEGDVEEITSQVFFDDLEDVDEVSLVEDDDDDLEIVREMEEEAEKAKEEAQHADEEGQHAKEGSEGGELEREESTIRSDGGETADQTLDETSPLPEDAKEGDA